MNPETKPRFFETWKGIGRAIGRSERWCRYMARRADPLPVFKVGGVVRLHASDFESWVIRERQRTIARDIPSIVQSSPTISAP